MRFLGGETQQEEEHGMTSHVPPTHDNHQDNPAAGDILYSASVETVVKNACHAKDIEPSTSRPPEHLDGGSGRPGWSPAQAAYPTSMRYAAAGSRSPPLLLHCYAEAGFAMGSFVGHLYGKQNSLYMYMQEGQGRPTTCTSKQNKNTAGDFDLCVNAATAPPAATQQNTSLLVWFTCEHSMLV